MSQPPNDFHAAYGTAMIEWTNLEVVLCIWFRKIAMIPSWEAAYAIFFSARSFSGRADMFTAALEHCPAEADQMEFLREAILRAISYNSARNEIAHGFAHHDGHGRHSFTPGKTMWKPGRITVHELVNMAANFVELRKLLIAAHYGFTGEPQGQPLPQCHERLRRLPSEACSNELSQKQRGRLRQLQSALRGSKKNTPVSQ